MYTSQCKGKRKSQPKIFDAIYISITSVVVEPESLSILLCIKKCVKSRKEC
jgi:hypothetical protein